MVIAGEVSGDHRAAELVRALRSASIEYGEEASPTFIGTGPELERAGAEPAMGLDLTAHAVIGPLDLFRSGFKFLRFFDALFKLALKERPDVFIFVDYSGFNLRFAKKLRARLNARRPGSFSNWNPKLIYYVSPQVWASRQGRVHQIAENIDLMLSIFPFEKEWYAQRKPNFPVEFVGYPLLDRHLTLSSAAEPRKRQGKEPFVVLLPGSRLKEVERHIPVMIAAARRIQAEQPIRLCMILPNEKLATLARKMIGEQIDIQIRIGGQAEVLPEADLAITKSGSVTMECALFGVPAVVIYITSWLMYQIARRIVKVRFLAMPNLIADETVYPELIQDEATGANIARQGLYMLTNAECRGSVRKKLRGVIEKLGEPGASRRAAGHIWNLIKGSVRLHWPR
jgi:lipid-A-disaccharide synthase